MRPPILIASNGEGLTRAVADGADRWAVTRVAIDARPHALATAPFAERVVYTGTSDGVWRSADAGATWRRAGLAGRDVRAIAASPVAAGLLVAGTRTPALMLSRDGGASWAELDAFRRLARWRAFFSPAEWPPLPYVSSIALSATNAEVIVAGLEVGGVAASHDGGRSWQVGRGAIYDCHSVSAHATDGLRFFQGGAGFRKAARVSSDGGLTWSGPRAIDGHAYGWSALGDPARPDHWYYAASSGPFAAHTPSREESTLYRVTAGRVAPVGGGLPARIAMPYQLLARDGFLYAGLANGDVWRSTAGGGSWVKLSLSLGRLERSLVIV